MFYSFLVITLMSLSLLQIRQSSAAPTVVGGTVATDIRDYPYIVSIHYSDQSRCGGTIISKWYVLTAAHCLQSNNTIDYIRSGSSLFDRGGSVHQALSNKTSKAGDVGVIRVKQPFLLNTSRRAVTLFDDGEDVPVGTEGLVAGWGKTEEQSDYPIHLQFAEVPIINRGVCNEIYNKTHLGAIENDKICAGYQNLGGKDACSGDSGGPLIVKKRQAGVVSFGLGCARPEYPGVYARVGYFRKWIRKNTRV